MFLVFILWELCQGAGSLKANHSTPLFSLNKQVTESISSYKPLGVNPLMTGTPLNLRGVQKQENCEDQDSFFVAWHKKKVADCSCLVLCWMGKQSLLVWSVPKLSSQRASPNLIVILLPGLKDVLSQPHPHTFSSSCYRSHLCTAPPAPAGAPVG